MAPGNGYEVRSDSLRLSAQHVLTAANFWLEAKNALDSGLLGANDLGILGRGVIGRYNNSVKGAKETLMDGYEGLYNVSENLKISANRYDHADDLPLLPKRADSQGVPGVPHDIPLLPKHAD